MLPCACRAAYGLHRRIVMSQLMEKIELLCGIPIFHTEDEKSAPESVGAFLEQESPFVCAPPLVEMLVKRCESQALPVVYKDEYGVFFICVKGKNGFYLAGPVCTEDLDYAGLNRFYEAYGIAGEEKKHPVKTVLFRILTYAAVISELENEAALDCQEILKENGLAEEMETEVEKEDTVLEIRKLDDDMYHHTYQEERYVMESVREGHPGEARRRSEVLFENAGILSGKTKNHYKNLAVTSVTVCTREAIAGGVSPARAYRLSDIFINRIDRCADTERLQEYSRKFAILVAEVKSEKASSSYTEQCKDYIYKNYNHKIYLEEIAEAIVISPGHLSRVFRQDMDMTIQEYIQKFRVERAANLLKYSEASLTEISDYVCFHSQSHFGNAFKRYMRMTPKQYRDQYKEKEFCS